MMCLLITMEGIEMDIGSEGLATTIQYQHGRKNKCYA